MKAPCENDVVRSCLDYLQLRGVMAWRANNHGTYDQASKRFRSFRGRKGVADILGVLPPGGRLLAVECKAPGGKLSADQSAFLADVQARGGLPVVARSVKDLENALEDLP